MGVGLAIHKFCIIGQNLNALSEYFLCQLLGMRWKNTPNSETVPVCLKSKCTDFLFNYLLDLPEITSYPLQSMTLVT
jgi:hypothetical protein